MTHDYNTKNKKECWDESNFVRLIRTIYNSEHKQSRMKMLGWRRVAILESNHNDLAQYGRRNNVVFSGIPENVPDSNSESTVISILSEIDVEVEPRDIKECHRIGKPTSKTHKTIAGKPHCFCMW